MSQQNEKTSYQSESSKLFLKMRRLSAHIIFLVDSQAALHVLLIYQYLLKFQFTCTKLFSKQTLLPPSPLQLYSFWVTQRMLKIECAKRTCPFKITCQSIEIFEGTLNFLRYLKTKLLIAVACFEKKIWYFLFEKNEWQIKSEVKFQDQGSW